MCPKSVFLKLIIVWGELGKEILNKTFYPVSTIQTVLIRRQHAIWLGID